jgi:peptide deformylase
VAILPIVQYPDARLSTPCKPVTEFTEELKTLAADMAETMYKAPGVGLAAPQIGRLIRMVVIDVSEEKNDLRVFINPVLSPVDEELIEGEEGCLSLPGLYEKVKRPAHVHVKAQDLEGESFEYDCDGLLAVCIQHECDHLDGIVFIDHLSRLKKSRAAARLTKMRREKAREAKAE